MRRQSTIRLATTVLCLLALAPAAHAQMRCPEGRTATGKCMDPGLAQMGRATVMVMTQTKFSYTAPPYLPIDDRTSRLPLQTHEIYNLFNSPPVTKPVTTVLLPVHGGPPSPFQLFRP
jgi:hypothetical protein